MECQTPGVQWPSVTRPADNTDALPLLSAPRLCVCGHPVYDDQEPRCPLCACQEHKPRLLAAGDHSAPAAAPGTGEAQGSQPELSGTAACCPLQQHAAARELCPRTLSASVIPATRCQRRPALGCPGRTPPPCGHDRARRRESRRPRASGPAVAALAPACRTRQHPAHAAAVHAVPPEPLSLAPKRVRTVVPSGLTSRTPSAAGTATGRTLPLSRASLAGNRPVWSVSATDLSARRVPVTSRFH